MSVIYTSSKIIGTTQDNKQLLLVELEADTVSDLPAYNAYDANGYLFAAGSKAHIIDDNAKMCLNGAGSWIQQEAGSSSYTRAEIDAIVSRIDATMQDLYQMILAIQ